MTTTTPQATTPQATTTPAGTPVETTTPAGTAVETTTVSSRRHHYTLAVLTLILALLTPLFLNTATASARRTGTEMAIANSVLRTINHQRAAHGLRPVTMNYNLIISARRHNLAMAAAQTMSHQLPGEAFFATRITRAGYHWSWAGENIGWHPTMTATAANQLETMMYNEKAPNDGHRRNILNPHFTNIGIDIYLDRTHHKLWFTTDYARP